MKSPSIGRGLQALVLLMALASACSRSENVASMAPFGASRAGQGGSNDAAMAGDTAGYRGAAGGGAGSPVTGSAGGLGGSGAQGGCWRLSAVDKVRFYPAPGRESQMLGAKIVGSNDSPTNGFVGMATIDQTPAGGQWSELSFANTTSYRWVKYYGPPGSYGAVAELEFYAASERLLGKGFGTSGSRDDAGNTFDRALDGDTSSFFEGPQGSDQYVGLDLGGDNVVATPTFSPLPGIYSSPQKIIISSATPRATVHYTTEGSTPSSSSMVYAGPVPIGSGTTVVKAIATASCMLDSAVAQGAFRVGSVGVAGNQSSMHIGNSLTDTVDGFLEPIAQSGGITLDFHRDTVPGAGTEALWTDYGAAWAADLEGHPYDQLTLQPFPNLPCYPVGAGSDSDYVNRFYGLAKQANPEVVLWIYQQWPKPSSFFPTVAAADRGDCLSGGSWLAPGWTPPIPSPSTWEDGIANQLAYQEAVRQGVMDLNPGKTVYVIPAGLALLNLKKEVEAGHVPGVPATDFFHVYFIDDGTDPHLMAPARWFVGLLFYACMFEKNPAGVDASVAGIAMDHAAKLEEIAWSTASSYRYSGVTR